MPKFVERAIAKLRRLPIIKSILALALTLAPLWKPLYGLVEAVHNADFIMGIRENRRMKWVWEFLTSQAGTLLVMLTGLAWLTYLMLRTKDQNHVERHALPSGKIRAESKDGGAVQIVDYGKEHIRKFVLVETCTINSSHLAEGKLYVDFTFAILNLSLFSVGIPLPEGAVIEGSILFKGNPLSGTAKLFENSTKHTNPTDRNNFTIRQWVNSDEARDVVETLENYGNLFDFSRAVVNVRNEELPDSDAWKLDLTRGMQNADFQNRIVVLGNENIRLSRGITLWHDRARNIEALTLALGMFYRAYNQLEQGEILSKETANSLKGRFMQALFGCFHDHKLEDEYSDNLPPLPDSITEQKEWIDSQCSKLRSLIDEQRQALADYVQNDGSIAE
jgi:hypothetical protein